MPTEGVEFITSEHVLSDFDRPFKVSAGPGAGKTYWLINNIKNILKNSSKLRPPSKISCITYTNVAVEEIKTRLDTSGDSVEVSTIHSFLYKCLVKPYVYLIRNNEGQPIVNIELLDGHDDHIPSAGKIRQDPILNRAVLQNRIIDDDELRDVLSSLDWHINGNTLTLQPREEWRRTRYKKLTNTGVFFKYKSLFWSEGTIHHEDVLYFAHEIIKSYPVILDFIASRYPYILVDEFQDTNPIQTKILKRLSDTGSIIGVIGDVAQSIFAFQGAARTDFLCFSLPEQQNYVMMYNRRSTHNIIKVLNHVRRGDETAQKCYREVDGTEVCLIVNKSIRSIVGQYKSEMTHLGFVGKNCIITRRNSTVTKLRNCEGNCDMSVWGDFSNLDRDRKRFIEIIISALEYANRMMVETAVKEAMKLLKPTKDGKLRNPFTSCSSEITEIFKTSIAVSLLEYLVNSRSAILTKNVFDFYADLVEFFSRYGITTKKIVAGRFKPFAQAAIVNDLVLALELGEEKNSGIRTIHKAKGAEFQSVLVYFDDNRDIVKYLLNPDISEESDDCRLYYVAMSRAEEFLCLATDELSLIEIDSLEELGIRLIGDTTSAPISPKENPSGLSVSL